MGNTMETFYSLVCRMHGKHYIEHYIVYVHKANTVLISFEVHIEHIVSSSSAVQHTQEQWTACSEGL